MRRKYYLHNGIEGIIKAIQKTAIDADDALRIVSALRNRGLIDIVAVKNTGRGAASFVGFLESFWDYDTSEYIRDKLSHGHRFTRYYTYGCQKRLAKYIKPFFNDKKLNCITTDDLKRLSHQLADMALATSTINQIMLVCCTPLKWAFNEKIIPENPVTALTRFSVSNKERGILTEAEAEAVFSLPWKNKKAFVASLLAATTGIRQGECLALRRSDIGETTLNIAHSYSSIDRLKCPKNGHKRIVPLLPEIRTALLDLLEDNPHNVDNPFIFFSARPDRPITSRIILTGLKNAMEKMNIDHKGRNITFHSWRHWFCSKITGVIDSEKVARVSGHLSQNVLKKYADHIETKNIQEVGNAAARVFETILLFRRGA
jgi:integrase